MKKVVYTILIPDDRDIDSIVINLDHKAKRSEQFRQIQDKKQDSNNLFKYEKTEEPDEGLLYDELY